MGEDLGPTAGVGPLGGITEVFFLCVLVSAPPTPPISRSENARGVPSGAPFVLQQTQNDRDFRRATGNVSGRLPALPSSVERSVSKTLCPVLRVHRLQPPKTA